MESSNTIGIGTQGSKSSRSRRKPRIRSGKENKIDSVVEGFKTPTQTLVNNKLDADSPKDSTPSKEKEQRVSKNKKKEHIIKNGITTSFASRCDSDDESLTFEESKPRYKTKRKEERKPAASPSISLQRKESIEKKTHNSSFKFNFDTETKSEERRRKRKSKTVDFETEQSNTREPRSTSTSTPRPDQSNRLRKPREKKEAEARFNSSERASLEYTKKVPKVNKMKNVVQLDLSKPNSKKLKSMDKDPSKFEISAEDYGYAGVEGEELEIKRQFDDDLEFIISSGLAPFDSFAIIPELPPNVDAYWETTLKSSKPALDEHLFISTKISSNKEKKPPKNGTSNAKETKKLGDLLIDIDLLDLGSSEGDDDDKYPVVIRNAYKNPKRQIKPGLSKARQKEK